MLNCGLRLTLEFGEHGDDCHPWKPQRAHNCMNVASIRLDQRQAALMYQRTIDYYVPIPWHKLQVSGMLIGHWCKDRLLDPVAVLRGKPRTDKCVTVRRVLRKLHVIAERIRQTGADGSRVKQSRQ